jgi:hypothetical protein
MQRIFSVLYYPLSPLVIFAVLLSAIYSTYLFAGMAPSPRFDVVTSLCWAFLLVYWMVADARRRLHVPCFDFGFLCYVLLPLSIPWYCFWSRGWRGALIFLVLLAIFLAPNILAMIVWRGLYGSL